MPLIADYDDIQDSWDQNDSLEPEHPASFGKARELTKPLDFPQLRLRVATLWPKQRNAPYGKHSRQRTFAIALAGKAHAVINGEAFSVRSGDCLWIPPDIAAALVNSSELPFSILIAESIEPDDEMQLIESPQTPKVATTASPRIVAISAVEPVNYQGLVIRPVGRALGVTGFDIDIIDLGEDGAPLPYHTRTGCEQLYCTIAGSVTLFAEGEQSVLKRYSAYYAPHGEKRALEALPRGQTRVAVFTVKTAEQDAMIRYARDGTPLPADTASTS